MSCTKGFTATVAHLLSERGLLDFQAPVAKYWPEFAASGKRDVTVRQLMNHSAGLFGFTPSAGMDGQGLLDWDLCTSTLAEMAPLWEPGTAFMYHMVTYGYLVGEVIRRVAGKTVGRVFADEIAGPLGLDIWIGLPESEEDRVATHFSTLPVVSLDQLSELMRSAGVDVEHPIARTQLSNFTSLAQGLAIINERAGHAAEVPAANGIGNARSIARLYAAHLGEVDGFRVLRPETIEAARIPLTDNLSAPPPLDVLPADYPLRFGLGYELSRAGNVMLGETSFGHAGAGGRLAFADVASGMSVGYTCTNMAWDAQRGPDARWLPWISALGSVG
ncbi:serine hydrolase domain-containing protein [Fodinicola feengrottensis]|uniref:Serine hydrolase domain-containing protein n=2 Tax=Fodinicola feengrottensis TaxID=435914 RepID=A0ABP4SDB3_9ACTN